MVDLVTDLCVWATTTFIVLALAISLLGLTSASLSRPRNAYAEPLVQHIVGFGETLTAIAQLTHATEADLAEINAITRGDTLIEGQQLNVAQPLAVELLYLQTW